MGNTCCCSCSAPEQVDYQHIFDKVVDVEDMTHIDELISYIDQLLNACIDQASIQSIARLAKTNRVAASINSGGGLLEKILKRSNRHLCKRDIAPNLNRETRKLVIDVTNLAAQIKWVGVALSVVGFVLERIEQISSNREECIQLLKYMCNLAKYTKQLEDHLAQEKLNRVLQFIVEGSLLCISRMQSHPLSKFFAAPVVVDDLRKLQRGLEQEYSELQLESLIEILNRNEEILNRGEEILNRIPVVLPPSQGTSPQAVGIEEARTLVTKLLDMENKSIKVVVIYGQGGIGKTTLATAVFSNLDLKNYKYCRVDMEQNCSEADLKVLQQQMLKDLYDSKIQLRSPNEGREVLSKNFKECSSKPVFIFIDNALKQSDLEKLLPITALASLPPQSRILITTRNLNETSLVVQEKVDRCPYQVNSLPQQAARKLLCELVLSSGQENFDPTIDINGLLEICQGIPLVINLAGARLREHAQNVPACRERVEYLKTWLLGGVEGELSERMVDFVYKRLDASCKEAFLDIVFFFCNWERDQVVYSVGVTEFEELERASLVNVTDEGRVNVHDIVKARGRMLSRNGERITDLQSLTDVLHGVDSIKEIKGIALNESFELEAYQLNLMKRCLRVLSLTGNMRIVNGECTGAFENLRLLSLHNYNNYSWMDVSKHPRLAAIILTHDEDSNIPKFAGTISSSLRYVYIQGVTLSNLTTTLCQVQSLNCLTLHNCSGINSVPGFTSNLLNLEKLDLRSCSSLESLPNSFGSLSCLKELYLNSCSSLGSLPNSFGSLFCLKELDLTSCSSLESLPNSFGSLSSLKHLNLRSCSSLKSLPNSFGSLSCLKELDLRSCSSLESLPNSFGSLSCLKELDLTSCFRLRSLPNSFGSLSSLEHLNLSFCSSLGSLPNSFGSLSCLKKLYLNSCSSLESLPNSFGSLSCLKELYLDSCSSLGSLPESFGSLSSLEHLNLDFCSSLGSLPNSFGSLSSLKELYLRSCSSLGSLPNSFGSLSCLKELYLDSCSSLGSLPESFGSLSSLEHLNLDSCSSLGSLSESFGSLSCLKELYLRSCSSLGSLPNSFGSLSCLKELYLDSCSSLGSLPESFGSLSSLEHLNLDSCSSLGSLSESFGSLSCLKELYLRSCSSLGSLPNSFGSLSCLKELYLNCCSSLGSLPNSFGSLSCLKELDLRSCSSLGSLPNSFGSLSCVKELYLNCCSSLGSLPNSFGSLSSLEHLNLSFCSSLGSLPNSFGSLSCLKKLYLNSCSSLESLPESLGNLAFVERLVLEDCEKLTNLPQNFGQLKRLKYVSIDGCSVIQSLSGDFECLSSLIAVKASECPQLEENTMEKLGKMKGLMMVDIDGSPMLKKRWEQVKEQYSLAAVECGSSWGYWRIDEGYPYADVMGRAFFHSESKFVHVDENGQVGESPSPAGGEKVWMVLKERDVTSSNSRCWEAVKKKWMEMAASEEGGKMIYVDVGGSWEEGERETRVRKALPHLPSGALAWIAPDNRASILFAHSVQQYYHERVNEEARLGVGNCIVSTAVCVDEEGRRRLHVDDLNFILPDLDTAFAESEVEGISDQLFTPIQDAIEFLDDIL